MIGSTRAIRVFAYADVTDMRKSYNGLEALVRNEHSHDILRGDLCLFVNGQDISPNQSDYKYAIPYLILAVLDY